MPLQPQTWTVQRLIHLAWPKAVDGVSMAKWTRRERSRVDLHEGMGVRAAGYIDSVSFLAIPESANCYGLAGFDTHLWLGARPYLPRKDAVITEVTPRTTAREHGFSEDQMERLAARGVRVRITGWLFLDNRHDAGVEKVRATLWEIHPVTQVDVWRRQRWATIWGP